MYKRNTEARSCNHCCSGRAKIITYYECVSIALDIQHAIRMRNLWHVLLYNIFPHYLINGTILGKRKVTEYKNVCLDFLYNFCLKHSSL